MKEPSTRNHGMNMEPPGRRSSAPLRAATVATIRLSELDAEGRSAWRRLADSAAEPNPFYRPEFVEAAAGAHGDDPLLLVVTGSDGWLGCLPVTPARRWRRLPILGLAPWMPDLAFVSTPLLDGDRFDEAAGALAGFIARAGAWGALVLNAIEPGGAVGTALTRAFAAAGTTTILYAEWERAALFRRPQPTYLEEAMSAKRRKEMRRLRRTLERETGGPVQVVERSADASACTDFLALERAGWKGEAGTALASTAAGAAFFRSMCAGLEADGRIQLLALQAGERTVAMQSNLIDGGVMFGFKVAYDPALARFSPGALLEVEALQVFHESPSIVTADSCAASDSELINRIWPDRRRLQTLIVPTGSWRGAAIRPSLAATRYARRIVDKVRRARS
jgi:CelD/BcsL family acetyltransferase involved in cellulose biosynthesis